MKCFLLVLLLMAKVTLAAQERVFLYPPERIRERDANGENGELFFGNSHLQQRFDSSLFQSTVPEGGQINLISPRLDMANSLNYRRDSSGIQIRIGIVPHGAGPLDPVFATNERISQSGLTTVLEFKDVSRISISPFELPGTRSGSYVNFGSIKPFFYDPRMGDLLVDLQVKAPTLLPALFDFDNEGGSGITSVFAQNVNETPSKGTVKDGGFIFTFGVVPVPEPSVLGIAAVGAVALGGLAAGKRKKDAANQATHSTWCK